MRGPSLAALLLFLLAAGVLVFALTSSPPQPPAAPVPDPYLPPKGYVCYRALLPPIIDGRLDDLAWEKAPWSDDFVDIEGDKKPKPRFRTRMKMLWDDQYLYVAAEMEEPHVWATLTQHDSVIFHDNDFEVFIDPDGDNHEYFEFEINALNTGWDLFLPRPYKDGGRPLDSWEIPGLRTGVHVRGTLNDPRDRDEGWTVEMAFPWKVLGQQARWVGGQTTPREGEQWRINFSRVEWQHKIVDGKYRKNPDQKDPDNWVWSPQGVIDMHRPERWGYVQFTRGQPGTVAFRPDPAGPVRHLLHRVYYAQREFRQKRERWATSLVELGLHDARVAGVVRPLLLETTTSGFEATALLRGAGERVQRWHIRQDSRIWVDD
jgi:hypothetical protein